MADGTARSAIRSVKDLTVWQRGMDLVSVVYRLTESFPKREWYGLAAQMRRAAVSVPANIAEGRGRFGGPDYARFLTIASGSLRELETYREISILLGYASVEAVAPMDRLTNEVAAMLVGMAKALRRKSTTTRK